MTVWKTWMNWKILNMKKMRRVVACLMAGLLLAACSSGRYTASDFNWWHYPLPGAKVISDYGRRDGRQHMGIDLKTRANDQIRAAFDGEVTFAGQMSGFGNLVRIAHANGFETYYAHNSRNLVKQGNRVKAGQVIALTGRTGRATTEHLHFETRIKGKPVNPNRFFDHAERMIRLNAFRKTNNGYVVK